MGKVRWKIAQFFEKRWWKNYLKKKDSAEYIEWKKNYWEELIQKCGFEKKNLEAPILDIGCGPAGIFTIFEGEKVTAIDPLLSEYEEEHLFKKADYRSVHFESVSFEDFQTTQKFRTVFCLNAINHFEDLEFSFKKLAEVADEDAVIFLSIDAHNHKILKRLFTFMQFDILHPHQYTLEDYEKYVTDLGMDIKSSHRFEKRMIFDYWMLVIVK